MTDLLEQALAKVYELPSHQQDAIAILIMQELALPDQTSAQPEEEHDSVAYLLSIAGTFSSKTHDTSANVKSIVGEAIARKYHHG